MECCADPFSPLLHYSNTRSRYRVTPWIVSSIQAKFALQMKKSKYRLENFLILILNFSFPLVLVALSARGGNFP